MQNRSIWKKKVVQPKELLTYVFLGLSPVTLPRNSAFQGCMRTLNSLAEKETDMKSGQQVAERLEYKHKILGLNISIKCKL